MIKPLVSVIVPVYNGEKFIRDALESILRQRITSEIIVIDDGSTDGTPAALRHFQDNICCERQANHGPACARNRGLNRAQGDVIAFLDADDIWPDDKLECQISYLQQDLSLEVVIGRIQCLRRASASDDRGAFVPFMKPFATYKLGSALFRRSVFEKIGDFDAGLRETDDFDWFMRARERGVKLGLIPEVTLFYRYHGQNITLNKAETDFSLARALKQSLDRRRARGTGTVQALRAMPEISIPGAVNLRDFPIRQGLK